MKINDSVLDRELETSVGDAVEREEGMTPERFAQIETARDEHRHQLVLKEEESYESMHRWAQSKGKRILKVFYALLAVAMLVIVTYFLGNTVLSLPKFGASDAPANQSEVVTRYIESGIPETGAVNFVAGMILDYRAFDTFGESTVLFVAACSVLILLKLSDHGKDEKPTKAMLEAEWDDRHYEPKNDEILQLAAKVLVPIILLYGFYVVLNGHLSPGGGFSGGAVMGAGLILYLNAFGFEKAGKLFTFKTFQWVTFLALMTYAGLKSYSFFCGANHLPSGIPLGTPGAILSSGLILPLNICVGFIVMCTMYGFYTLFRKGGMS